MQLEDVIDGTVVLAQCRRLIRLDVVELVPGKYE